jgi:hypothetical protein
MYPSWTIISTVVTVVFLVAIVAAGLLERRPVQPYIVPRPDDIFEPTSTAASENSVAESLNYQHNATAHDGKGRLYRVRYDFWISPDRCTLAVIGGGTVASIPVDGVWLWSRVSNGQILCTTNEIGEQDISGIVQQETWPTKTLSALCERHANRLQTVRTVPFPTDQPLRGLFEIRRAIADALVDRGYAYYISDDRLVWRYTLSGAFAFYVAARWLRPIGRFFRFIALRQAR